MLFEKREKNWHQQVKSHKLLVKCIRKNKTQNSQKWTQNGCPVFQWRVPVAAVLIYRLLIATYTVFWLIYSTVKQDVSVNMFSLFFQWQWTVPHLSVMIIYNSTRSILIQWIRVILTIWPSENKKSLITHTKKYCRKRRRLNICRTMHWYVGQKA